MQVYIFPGQGSQARGMGKGLFEQFPDLVQSANKILGYSIEELCLEDPQQQLGQTQFTQPALYVVNALSYYKKIAETNQKPDFVAGHSLGEFNALLASECFSFSSGLKLVKKRGELMREADNGAMAAIINLSEHEIRDLLQQHNLHNIDLANFNTMSQIVISGDKDEVAKSQEVFQKGNALFFPLNTSGAFHSRFMSPLKRKFLNYLKKFNLQKLQIPVIANVTGTPYKQEKILEYLSNQMDSPVRWTETVQYLLAQKEMEFVEIGHGDVLTKLVKKIKRDFENCNDFPADKKKSTEATESFVQSESVSRVEAADSVELTADQKVANWNQQYPIGTKVVSTLSDYSDLITRTEAIVLFGHRAVVYMEGYNGYFCLDELIPKT